MRERSKTFAAFGVSLCGVCAFLAAALLLGSLNGCSHMGGTEITSPPPPASSTAPFEQPSSDPASIQNSPASEAVTPPLAQPSAAQPSAQNTPSSEPASQSPVPSISIPAAVTFPEIPMDDYTRNSPVPDFLDKDQQLLYRQALYVYNHLFGGDTSEVCIGNEDKFPDKEYTVTRNGILYTKATGRYAVWTDFDGMIHSVFTDNFWTGCNDDIVFINIDGTLYYLDAAMGREYRNENFPDTFKLNSKTDNEIVFTLTGYYSSPWPNEGETSEQRDQRLKNGWEYTLDFTIKLVRTADGWRFDEFHSTAGDQVGPEEAG